MNKTFLFLTLILRRCARQKTPFLVKAKKIESWSEKLFFIIWEKSENQIDRPLKKI